MPEIIIPKIIHYCWFGGKPLPKDANECIQSWKRFFPEYEIKEWNESNYDVNKIEYTREAYESKKYAFVSDYARFDILYHFGGIYFDTDVEVIKPFDDILKNGAFMGCESDGIENPAIFEDGYLCTCTASQESIQVNPGLGIAAAPGLDIYKDLLELYSRMHFLSSDGQVKITKTVVGYTTELLREHGLKNIKGLQKVSEITIYPKEYFCPMDYKSGLINITSRTHSIHHYKASWSTPTEKNISKISIRYENKPLLRRILILPYLIKDKLDQGGVQMLFRSIFKKIKR